MGNALNIVKKDIFKGIVALILLKNFIKKFPSF